MNRIFPLLFILMYCGMNAQNLESKKVITNDSVYISLKNPFLAPVELNFAMKDDFKGKLRIKKNILFKPKEIVDDVFIAPLTIIKDTTSIDINEFVSVNGTLGNSRKANHNDKYLYTLPFSKGRSYKIIQSFGGKFSHYKKHSKYAIDFNLQIGDTITAAREGLVIMVKEDSKEYGKTYKFADKGNKIVIMHNDGTFANYVHLDFNGAIVKIGDLVKAGQSIGISGLTGFTTLPHLHFVVLEPGNTSVPIYFKGIGRKKLKPGKRYKRKE